MDVGGGAREEVTSGTGASGSGTGAVAQSASSAAQPLPSRAVGATVSASTASLAFDTVALTETKVEVEAGAGGGVAAVLDSAIGMPEAEPRAREQPDKTLGEASRSGHGSAGAAGTVSDGATSLAVSRPTAAVPCPPASGRRHTPPEAIAPPRRSSSGNLDRPFTGLRVSKPTTPASRAGPDWARAAGSPPRLDGMEAVEVLRLADVRRAVRSALESISSVYRPSIPAGSDEPVDSGELGESRVEASRRVIKTPTLDVQDSGSLEGSSLNALARTVDDTCLASLCALRRRYKYVVTTLVRQRAGGGTHAASAARWNPDTDGVCSLEWRPSESLEAFTTVFYVAV